MTVPSHSTPPSPQDLETELAAVAFAIARVLPPMVAGGFIQGLQLAARAQIDAGNTNSGNFLEGLAAALPQVVAKATP